jgi:hypothetical protein
MNIPITKRVMMGGGKKGCGCGCDCKCGKTPAKKGCGSMAKKMNDMYNGIPGVQKDDFKQFS